MADKRIHGAVSIGNGTFVEGQEAEFEAAIKDAEKGTVDIGRLSEAGVISGFGEQTPEPEETVNRQRRADGERADKSAAKAEKEAAGAKKKRKAEE